jgi:hypothetical protein
MTSVRVHTHPRPVDHDYDFHLPYFGNSYDQPLHGTKSYLKEFLKRIPTDNSVCLVSNREPASRCVAVKHIIGKTYSNTHIQSNPPLYNQQDNVFQNGYKIIPTSQELNAKVVVELYLELYQKLNRFSQRYTYQFHDRDHGYFDSVKRHWYQFGQHMPAPPDQYHSQMYQVLQPLFDQLVMLLEPVATSIGLDQNTLKSNLMIRLNHNPPDSLFENQLLVNRHADNSIFTAWVFENQSGGHIDFGQEHEQDACAIESLFDSQKQIMLFPGFDYCDQTKTMAPATFHSVRKTNNQHRVSIVAFVKK